MRYDPIPGTTFVLRENPLATSVVLTEPGRREYVMRFALKMMSDLVWDVHFSLSEGRSDVDRAKNQVDAWTGMAEHDALPEDSFEFWEAYASKHGVATYLSALEDDVHDGDCTSVACSCVKCYAESIAGVMTHHWDKRVGHAIASRFRKPHDGVSAIANDMRKKAGEFWEKMRRDDPKGHERAAEAEAKTRERVDAILEEHARNFGAQMAVLKYQETDVDEDE